MPFTRTYVTPAQVFAFSRSWLFHGLPIDADIGLTIERDHAGNLVGLSWDDGQDYWECETSGALLALVNDATAGQLD